MRECIAILLSGGTGTRLGVEIPKQYIATSGRMMITRSLMALAECGMIRAVQIVAQEDRRGKISEEWKAAGKRPEFISGFSDPGETRQLSALNAMEDIVSQYGEEVIVLIHDAARPFVSRDTLESCILACDEHDGAMPVLPMKDTVYYSEDGRSVKKLLEREKIFAGQAPETFVLGKYLKANRDLLPDKIFDIKGSSEPAIMAGMDIALIPGEEKNFKVTTLDDLKKYEQIVLSGQ